MEDVVGEDFEFDSPGFVGAWPKPVSIVCDASEEVMLLWGLQQPTVHRPNAYVKQAGLVLHVDACGRELSIAQAPSTLSEVGITGGVMWDSGVVLAKFLEHAGDEYHLELRGKKVVELGSGCGLVGCVAALLGADTILTDVPDRLKLLQKNVRENAHGFKGGSARVMELTWGEEPEQSVWQQLPDFVVASDVIYCEDVVPDLLDSLKRLSGPHTTVFLSGELRNDSVLECFFEAALIDFDIGRIPIEDWHPEFLSSRVAIYVLCPKART